MGRLTHKYNGFIILLKSFLVIAISSERQQTDPDAEQSIIPNIQAVPDVRQNGTRGALFSVARHFSFSHQNLANRNDLRRHEFPTINIGAWSDM